MTETTQGSNGPHHDVELHEPTAAEWKARVERFLLTWHQAGNILRYRGYERVDDLIPELLGPLWQLTDLGGEDRPIQENQLHRVHESAEHLVPWLEDFAAAMAETDVPESDGYPIPAGDVLAAVREKPAHSNDPL